MIGVGGDGILKARAMYLRVRREKNNLGGHEASVSTIVVLHTHMRFFSIKERSVCWFE